MEPVVPSVFDEMEQYKPINYASTGQRFANMIIDTIGFYIIFVVFVFVVALADGVMNFGFVEMVSDESLSSKLKMQLISLIIWYLYFFLFEALSKGRTIGKLITGTLAVKQNGDPISFKDAALRTLCRLIPFEPFSAFGGTGLWHDRLAKTEVVKTR